MSAVDEFESLIAKFKSIRPKTAVLQAKIINLKADLSFSASRRHADSIHETIELEYQQHVKRIRRLKDWILDMLSRKMNDTPKDFRNSIREDLKTMARCLDREMEDIHEGYMCYMSVVVSMGGEIVTEPAAAAAPSFGRASLLSYDSDLRDEIFGTPSRRSSRGRRRQIEQ